MMDWLALRGYDCTVLTTYPYYPYWQVQEPYRKNRFWYKTEKIRTESGGSLKIIRCPIYVPTEPSGIKRIMLDFSFLLTSFFPLVAILIRRKMNTVIAVAPSFLIGLPAVIYRWIRGGRFVYHIQDMQIEAARDLGMIKSKKIVSLLFGVEKFICRQADIISSISAGMIKKLRVKFSKEIYFFPNWTNISQFHPLENRAQAKMEFGFDSNDKVMLYSGGIGKKQGLEAIIEAADYFQKDAEIKFVICGSGPYKSVLQAKAEKKGLANVYFFPLQPLEKFNNFLNMADVHLVIQKADASDLMMPSKLTSILSVGGLALITANPGSGLYTLVDTYEVGIIAPAENTGALIEAMKLAVSPGKKNQTIRKQARLYAEKFLNIDEIMTRFVVDLVD